MAQVLRYHEDEYGSHAPGLPRHHLTDADVADLARARGTTPAKIMQEALAFTRPDGKPLYTETAKTGEAADAPAPKDKPRVPMGTPHQP